MKAVAVIGVAVLALGAGLGVIAARCEGSRVRPYEAALSSLTKLSDAESSAPDVRRQAGSTARSACLRSGGPAK
jgi:hypothetical protein